MFADETLHPSSLVLKTYTDERMEVMGTLNMQVQYGEQKKKLVLVVGGNGPSLLGRNWLKHIKLDWSSIVAVRTIKMKPLHTLMQCHQQLFSEGLGQNRAIYRDTPRTTRHNSAIFQTSPGTLCHPRRHWPGD